MSTRSVGVRAKAWLQTAKSVNKQLTDVYWNLPEENNEI